MAKLDDAKQIIRICCSQFDCGIFNSRNIVGDEMYTLCMSDGLVIDICPEYRYFEVFGLTDDEFHELKEYYNTVVRKNDTD